MSIVSHSELTVLAGSARGEQEISEWRSESWRRNYRS